VIFGVDTGLKIRWVKGDQNGLFGIGEVDSYEDLQRECDKHKDWIMVIDQGGDIIGCRQFAEDNPGQVFLCYFVQDKKSMEIIKWGRGEDSGIVRADRNRLIQLVVDEMNDKRIPLCGDMDQWWGLWTHWQWMYRIVDEDRMGNLVYVWACDKSAHRNDWALAMCYWRVAIDRFATLDSYFAGKDDTAKKQIPEAPYREFDGAIRGGIIPPELLRIQKDDDWRN
jgi:hypothetical protein